MTPTRIALCLIAAIFVVAELVRPTHVPAKKSARSLILRSQAVSGVGTYASLDPNLLDDLPRIHPDATGQVQCSREHDGSFRLFGTFYGADVGSAVFVVSDMLRLGAGATIFDNATRPHEFVIEIPVKILGSGKHRLNVALVSSDQRGFFILPQPIAVTVGVSSHVSDNCQTIRRSP